MFRAYALVLSREYGNRAYIGIIFLHFLLRTRKFGVKSSWLLAADASMVLLFSAAEVLTCDSSTVTAFGCDHRHQYSWVRQLEGEQAFLEGC